MNFSILILVNPGRSCQDSAEARRRGMGRARSVHPLEGGVAGGRRYLRVWEPGSGIDQGGPWSMKAFARVVSAIFNPVLYIGLFLLYLIIGSHGQLWGPSLTAFLFLGALPAGLLFYGIHRGWWSDIDISRLHERRTYLPWVLLSAVVLFGITLAFHYPRIFRFTLTGILTWLTITTVVSWYWKISIHEGAVVGVVALMWLLYGSTWGLGLIWTPFLVGWARLELRRHTFAQLVAGAGAALFSMGVAWFSLHA